MCFIYFLMVNSLNLLLFLNVQSANLFIHFYMINEVTFLKLLDSDKIMLDWS